MNIFAFFSKLAERVRASNHRAQNADLERHLSQAQDAVHLEDLQRQWERRSYGLRA